MDDSYQGRYDKHVDQCSQLFLTIAYMLPRMKATEHKISESHFEYRSLPYCRMLMKSFWDPHTLSDISNALKTEMTTSLSTSRPNGEVQSSESALSFVAVLMVAACMGDLDR